MRLICGDCLEEMHGIAAASVDMILCDLPYGVTQCRWDSVIHFEPLWEHYRRIIKPRGAIVLTASQPFTSMLVMSNPKWFRHAWIWDKQHTSNFQQSQMMPLRQHEDVLVFSPGRCPYYPQMTEKDVPLDMRNWKMSEPVTDLKRIRNGSRVASRKIATHSYPRSILQFCSVADECNGPKRLHPTQKPVALMEYLIKTYTTTGETVLDNCMGSGTTGVACVHLGRDFIGIEKDADYFAIAQDRIAQAQAGLFSQCS